MENQKVVGKRMMTGVVVSDKMDKSIVVKVDMRKTHPLYGKVMRSSKRIKAHDESNTCKLGDTVKVIECRPVSKEKCWRLYEVVERAK